MADNVPQIWTLRNKEADEAAPDETYCDSQHSKQTINGKQPALSHLPRKCTSFALTAHNNAKKSVFFRTGSCNRTVAIYSATSDDVQATRGTTGQECKGTWPARGSRKQKSTGAATHGLDDYEKKYHGLYIPASFFVSPHNSPHRLPVSSEGNVRRRYVVLVLLVHQLDVCALAWGSTRLQLLRHHALVTAQAPQNKAKRKTLLRGYYFGVGDAFKWRV